MREGKGRGEGARSTYALAHAGRVTKTRALWSTYPCAALQLHRARELLVCFVYVNMFVLPVHGDTRSLIFNFAGRERLDLLL